MMSQAQLLDMQPGLYMSLVYVLNVLPSAIQCGVSPSRPTRTLTAGVLAYAVGMPILQLRDHLPLPIAASILLGNMSILLSMGLFWHATVQVTRRKPPLWTLAVAPAFWAFCCLSPRFMRLLDLRVMVATLLMLPLLALPLLYLLHAPRKSMMHWALAATGGLQLFVSVHRGWLAWHHQLLCRPLLGTMIEDVLTVAYIVLWPALTLLLLHQRSLEEERRRGLQDELSGALNRRGFLERAATLRQRSLLLFDIDHFKRINDTLGHSAGDRTIALFSQVARTILGPDWLFARIGGEEFVAAGRDVAPEEAALLAERIRRAFSAAPSHADAIVTVSTGIALCIDDGSRESLSEQLARADRALYRAKRDGRDRIELSNDLEEHPDRLGSCPELAGA